MTAPYIASSAGTAPSTTPLGPQSNTFKQQLVEDGRNFISRVWSGITGGAARDAERQKRADAFGQAALAGSISAARYILGGLTNTASHERPMYQAWVDRLRSQAPDILAEAQAQGPLWDVGDTTSGQHSANVVQAELSDLWNKIRSDVANTVQHIGAGATNAATQAIAPDGSAQNSPITIPTNVQQLALIGLAIVALFLIMRKR